MDSPFKTGDRVEVVDSHPYMERSKGVQNGDILLVRGVNIGYGENGLEVTQLNGIRVGIFFPHRFKLAKVSNEERMHIRKEQIANDY